MNTAGRARINADPVDTPAHVVHFYQEDAELVRELVVLLGTSLVCGDACIVVATPLHRHILSRELAARDVNVDKATAEGRLVQLDAAKTLSLFMVDGMPDAERFTSVLGKAIESARAVAKSASPRTLIFGEMVALLWAEGRREAAIRLEELWNELAEKYSFRLRCAYPLSAFHADRAGELFAEVCEQHSSVVSQGEGMLLADDDERLRTIAALQQKLHTLESERALRDSEQRFRLLVEAVQDYAIFVLDADGRVSSWNIGAERLKGYKSAEILGQHFSRFYPEEDVRASKPERELEIARREGRVEDEGWRIRKDGSRFWANVVITALRGPKGNIIGYAKVTRDFTQRMQTESALRESERRLQNSEHSLRELSLHLLRTQDEERRRIGRDLHDSLGQYLSALKMKLDSQARGSKRRQPDPAELRECAGLAEQAIKEVRTISYLLYPPMLEEMGLKSAIPWYLEGFSKRSGIETVFEASAEFGRLAPAVELALFRVLQESLTNVHRHSGSAKAWIRLSSDANNVSLEVRDEGKGTAFKTFDEANRDWMGCLGVGLRGMSERLKQIGGKLELCSGDGGTAIVASVPVEAAIRE